MTSKKAKTENNEENAIEKQNHHFDANFNGKNNLSEMKEEIEVLK